MTSKTYADLFDEDDYENDDNDVLEAQLQQVVNDYHPEERRRTDEGNGIPSSSAHTFATAKNLDSSIAYLSTSLTALGFTSELPLRSGKADDTAKVCNTLYAMIHQQHRDTERIRDLEDGLSRMESSLQIGDQARRRLESRLLAKDREIGNLENKLQTSEVSQKTEGSKLSLELAEVQRQNTDLARRHHQFMHELRRRDKEFERLQAKLHTVLTEKNKESKANMDAASRFIDTGNRSTAPRRDDDLYKRIVASYEEKQRELWQENKELRAALESLQAEHRAIANLQIQRAQQLSSIKKTVEQEFAQELQDLTPLGVEAKLRAKLESTQILINHLNQQSSATPLNKPGRSSNSGEQQLVDQVRAARRLLTDLEVLARLAVDTLATASRSARQSSQAGVSNDGSTRDAQLAVQRLEEEYRAKVMELESKMSTAQMQGRSLGESEAAFKAQFEEERRKVDETRLALVEEKARAAKQLEKQRERLQQESALQAEDLGKAKWEFENHQAAFQETMKHYLPGFGAGTFLVKGMVKKTAKEVQDRGRDGSSFPKAASPQKN